jgi:hypothetical protein
MADPLGLTDNPIANFLRSVAGKPSPKASPTSSPKQTTMGQNADYAKSKGYKQTADGYYVKDSPAPTKKVTTMSKKKKAPAAMPKVKANEKHVKPGYPAPKKKK